MAQDFYDHQLVDTLVYLAKDKASANSLFFLNTLSAKQKEDKINELAIEHIQKQIGMLGSTKPDEALKYFDKDTAASDFRHFELAEANVSDPGTTLGVVGTVSAVVIILLYGILHITFGLNIIFTLIIAVAIAAGLSYIIVSSYLKEVEKTFFMYGQQLEPLKHAYAKALKQIDNRDTET